MSRASTRTNARTEQATVSAGDGIREWIAAIGPDSKRVPVATFDTKMTKPRLPGSAARAAASRRYALNCGRSGQHPSGRGFGCRCSTVGVG